MRRRVIIYVSNLVKIAYGWRKRDEGQDFR